MFLGDGDYRYTYSRHKVPIHEKAKEGVLNFRSSEPLDMMGIPVQKHVG